MILVKYDFYFKNNEGKWIQKSNKKHKIASLTKIWTALIVLENSNLDDEVVVSKRATLQQGSSIYLKENQICTIKDLVHGMLLRSGNDASVALAEHIAGSEEKFVKIMNKRAKEFGIKNTKFVDVTGLGNNISTAKDVAIMFELALKNSKFKDISGQSSYKNSLDEIANKYIEGWTIDRIDKTGAAILRMGLYELKFTDNTQFIIVTHRRGTMEAANVLYGVTMQENGISKLLKMQQVDIPDEIMQ